MPRRPGTAAAAVASTVFTVGLLASPAQAAEPLTCANEIATIVGTADDDDLRGTSGDDVIVGLGGNDDIVGLDGRDVICGNGGSDAIRGGGGDDYMLGGENAPPVAGEPAPEDFWGGPGDDFMAGTSSSGTDDPTNVDRLRFDNAPRRVLVDLSDKPYGDARGVGDDLFMQIEIVYGTDFDDSMYGRGSASRDIDPADTSNDDKFYGLGGDDYLLGRGGRDELVGGSGLDEIAGGDAADGLHGGPGSDEISGGKGADLADGDDGEDVVSGDEGDDILDGGTGDDRVRGGDQFDILSDPSGVDLADAGPDGGYCSRSFETRINCTFLFSEDSIAETSQLGDRAVDRSLRDARAQTNARTCRGEPATIRGTAGRDELVGTSARDVINGGRGQDRIFGMGGNDLICGNRGGDHIRGGPGNDGLFGEADGYDANLEVVLGDHLWGGSGDDIFSVGIKSGINIAHFNDSTAPITLRGNRVTGFGNDTLIDVRRVQGSDFDDLMVDGDTARVISGGAGNDTIMGRGGDDQIGGDFGDDLVRGGDGNDRLAGYEDDDRIEGGAGDDELIATSGLELMLGGPGDDELDAQFVQAGDGTARMYGGFGDDAFYGGDGAEIADGGWHRAGDACFSIDEPAACEFLRRWP